MMTQSTEIAEQSHGKRLGMVARPLGGLLLALMVAGGIAGQHLMRTQNDEVPVRPVAAVTDPIPVDGPAQARTTSGRNTGPTPILYIVGSQAQGEGIQQLSADLGPAATGSAPIGVLVLADATAEEAFPGLPRPAELRIIDLR